MDTGMFFPAAALIAAIKGGEGLRLEPYEDSGGRSIGYGTHLPLSEPEADMLLTLRYGRPANPYQHTGPVIVNPVLWGEVEADALLVSRLSVKMRHLARELKDYDIDWRALPAPVRESLANMAYQLGVRGVLRFKRMLAAVKAADWHAAHREALDSDWAHETPKRAGTVARGFRTVLRVQLREMEKDQMNRGIAP